MGLKLINVSLIIVRSTDRLTVQSITSCRPHCARSIVVRIQNLELSFIVQLIRSSFNAVVECIVYFLIIGDQIPQCHCSLRILGSIGDYHTVLRIWKMCNIFYHVRIVNIVFRMKNCLSHIGINVMDLQSCFTILKFRAVRV